VITVLAMALTMSGIVTALLLAAGYVDRDQNGVLTWSGRLWLLCAMAIVCGWAAAGWAMWGDPDRTREGAEYWTLAVPLFGFGYSVLALACLLGWWVARRLLGRGWIPALLIPAVASPVMGPWWAGSMLVACLAADYVFNHGRKGDSK
jgi:hypothetical protein